MYKTIPQDHMSTGNPYRLWAPSSSISGATSGIFSNCCELQRHGYAQLGVPQRVVVNSQTPGSVLIFFASPKSASFTVISFVPESKMFSGLTSRCTHPLPCYAKSAPGSQNAAEKSGTNQEFYCRKQLQEQFPGLLFRELLFRDDIVEEFPFRCNFHDHVDLVIRVLRK